MVAQMWLKSWPPFSLLRLNRLRTTIKTMTILQNEQKAFQTVFHSLDMPTSYAHIHDA